MKSAENISGHKNVECLAKIHKSCRIPILAIEGNNFFLNNQPDALVIQIYSVMKLYMFRTYSLPIIRSSVLYFTLFLPCIVIEFHPDSDWKRSSKPA